MTSHPSTASLPYRNAKLPIPERVADLLARMTPAEKARQLDMYMGSEFFDKMRSYTQVAPDSRFSPEKSAAAVGDLGCGVVHDFYPTEAKVANTLQHWFRDHTRLGIPPLIVEEALHGFGRPDSTVFPQCIGLGATFDSPLVERIGAAIGAEMRTVGVHLSLSPVLCLAREPRWGRSEETFGEDPWLAGELGRAYCVGMQGDLGPLNVVAEPKHFAGHGSPQAGLNQGPVHIGEREAREVMFKAFRPAFEDAKALGAMCAYHELDGIPCAANPALLTDMLRGEWKFEGVVISDLGAIQQLQNKHHIAADPRDAICQAMRAGLDVQFYDYDHVTWEKSITSALAEGILEPAVLDRSVGRVLALKFRLGLFDNPDAEPGVHERLCRSREHLDLSLEAARKSLVLLKNEGGLLPLAKSVKRIALLGPSAAVPRFGDYSGIGDGKALPILDCLRTLLPGTEIVHEIGVNIDSGDIKLIPTEWLRTPDGKPGLLGEYVGNGDLTAKPDLTRIDPAIDYNWAIAVAAPGMPADGFAVRWTGTLTPDRDLDGSIGFVTADAVRVWLDGKLVLDAWETGHGAASARNASVVLRKGESHAVRIEWRKRGAGSVILFGYDTGGDGIAKAVAAAKSSDIAILCLGESDRTSGEGIDRVELGLPGRQNELLQAVQATGKPLVVVLQNGRPLAVPEIKETAGAIIEAWFPGERGGQAIAEALIGVVNPGGKLPVTVPRHVGQLPLTYDRKPSHQGRYVETDGMPLWPFGFGLSYTTFAYSELSLSAATITASGSLEVSCTVANTGDRAGDEVVQLYLNDPVASVTRPVRWLAGCARVTLQPGEKRRVKLKVGTRELELWSRERKWLVEAGEYRVEVGGGQGGPLHGTFRVAG